MRFCGKGNCPALEYPPCFAYRLVIRHRIIACWRQPLYSRPNQSRSPGIWQVDDYELRGITLDITGPPSGIASDHVNRASAAPVHVVVGRRSRTVIHLDAVEPNAHPDHQTAMRLHPKPCSRPRLGIALLRIAAARHGGGSPLGSRRGSRRLPFTRPRWRVAPRHARRLVAGRHQRGAGCAAACDAWRWRGQRITVQG